MVLDYIENDEKLKLIQKIQDFIYDSKFKNLKVFSRQYLSSILFSMFSNENNSFFSLAFGDFDKLRSINDKYSVSVGDQAMYDALGIIKSILPPDTLIARASGDEFVFLSTSLTKKDWDASIATIVQTLTANSELLHGLNITMSGMDSNVYQDFDSLYNLAELDAGRKKQNNKQLELKTKQEIFKEKILYDLRKYFNYYRLNEGTSKPIELPPKFFTTLKDSIINIIINRFEKADTPLDFYMEILENTLKSNETFLKYLEIPCDSANCIHNLLLGLDESTSLNDIYINNLQDVLHFLVRDPLTGEFSKTYLKNYLLPKIVNGDNTKISVQMFDLVHLKLSNDTITHVKTDEKIAELFGHIIYTLRSNVDFSDFNHDSGNYLISYGGKLVNIQYGDFTVSDDIIEQSMKAARQNQRILNVISAKQSGFSSQLGEILSTLEEQCIKQKSQLKIDKISDSETIVALNIALNDSITYFINNFPLPYSLDSKKYLVGELWDGIFTVMRERYPDSTSYGVYPIRNISSDSPSWDSDSKEEMIL